MIGDALKVSPIFRGMNSEEQLKIYFPGGAENFWCPIEVDLPQCFIGGSY